MQHEHREPETSSSETQDILRILDRYPIHTAPELLDIIRFQMENTSCRPRINWTLQRIENVLWKLDGTGVEIFDTCICSVTGKILNRWWLRERPIRVFPVLKGFLVS